MTQQVVHERSQDDEKNEASKRPKIETTTSQPSANKDEAKLGDNSHHYSEEGSQSPLGRVKAPPVCSSPSLKREALSRDELSRMCFSPGDTLISSAAAIIPSSSSSAASNASNKADAVLDNDENPKASDNGTSGVPSPSGTAVAQVQSRSLNAKVLKRTYSRQGRMNQRWVNESRGLVRLVTGCVPIMNDGRILFVSASRKNEWILPKGGWEADETMEESAIRETFEEAGVLGTLGPKLTEVEYETRKAKKRRLEREEMLKKKMKAEADISSGGSDLLHSSEDEHHHNPQDKLSYLLVQPSEITGTDTPPAENADIAAAGAGSVSLEASRTEETALIAPGLSVPIKIEPSPTASNANTGFDDTASVASCASVASEGSVSYTLVKMTLFPLYVSRVEEEWPESGRARKVVDIDEAIAMLESRPEFRTVLIEVKEKGLHLVSTNLSNGMEGS